MWVYGAIAAVFVAGVTWLVRWMSKWKDASGDSPEGQSKARLWSKNAGGGSPG